MLAPVAERNLPFCVVLGNHDAEQDVPRAGIGTSSPYAGTLNTLNADGELADVVLEIAGKKSPAALLYCLDSHDYPTVEEGIDGYGWSRRTRCWYRDRSAPIPRQRRETAAGRWPFPYRPARICRRRRGAIRQYACNPGRAAEQCRAS